MAQIVVALLHTPPVHLVLLDHLLSAPVAAGGPTLRSERLDVMLGWSDLRVQAVASGALHAYRLLEPLYLLALGEHDCLERLEAVVLLLLGVPDLLVALEAPDSGQGAPLGVLVDFFLEVSLPAGTANPPEGAVLLMPEDLVVGAHLLAVLVVARELRLSELVVREPVDLPELGVLAAQRTREAALAVRWLLPERADPLVNAETAEGSLADPALLGLLDDVEADLAHEEVVDRFGRVGLGWVQRR